MVDKKISELDSSILGKERADLDTAKATATETGQPQIVKIAGRKVTVKDPGRAGTELAPEEPIESVI